jgi:hypothetical protein
MKKIALILALLISVTSVSFAAAAPKKAAPAASDSESQGFTGVSLNLIPCLPGAAPSARFGFGNWSLDAGGSLNNTAAGTSITIFGKGEIPISKIGSDVRTYWAPELCLYSPAGGGGSTTVISVYLGAEYMFASRLALFADLTAISLMSAGGTTTWTIGGSAAQVYTGGRLYF